MPVLTALAIVTGASSLNIVGQYIVPSAFSFAFLTSMIIYLQVTKKLTPETMYLQE